MEKHILDIRRIFNLGELHWLAFFGAMGIHGRQGYGGESEAKHRASCHVLLEGRPWCSGIAFRTGVYADAHIRRRGDCLVYIEL